MEYSNEQVVDAIGNLSVMQLIALTKQLEKKWGVKAVPQAVQIQVVKEVVAEVSQTEFNLTLVSFAPDKKMGLIKLVREVLAIGLLESKTLVESVPKLIKEGISKEEADSIKAKLEEAGAVMEMK